MKSPLPCRWALLLALCPAAVAAGVELRLDASGAAPVLHATGEFADGCPRAIAGASADLRELTLQLRRGSECGAEPVALALSSADAGEPLPTLAAGVYRLRLQSRGENSGADRLEAFALAEVGASGAPPRPEAGFWWGESGGEYDTARPGFGVQLEAQGDTLAVAVSGYDDAGAPQWLVGAARFSGRTARIPLGRLAGGSGPFGAGSAPQAIHPAGVLHIEWLGAARALFWFERPTVDGSIELQPMSMVRFGFAGQQQWQGRWLLAGVDDDAVAPRGIDFGAIEVHRERFVALGGAGERLDCRTDESRRHSPPVACTLHLADGVRMELDDVGLGRLAGRDAAGRAVLLLRLER